MKITRFAALCALFFMSFALHAQEEPLFYANDFVNQNEIEVFNKQYSARCQAVRIHPNWYLTAAHCVKSLCDGGECFVQINLVQGNLSARAFVAHTKANPTVFAYEGFNLRQNRNSSFDVALIRYAPYNTEYFNNKTGLEMTRKTFAEAAAKDTRAAAQWNAAVNPKRVRLLNFSTADHSLQLKRVVAVPRIAQSGIFFYQSGGAPVYYVKELQHLLTANFGVEKGMSGSGVLTNTGELAGVVSSAVYNPNGSASFFDDQGKLVARFDNLNNYFLFAGFNGATLNFIRNTLAKYGDSMADIGVVTADGEFAAPANRSFKQITRQLSGDMEIRE